MSNDKQPPPPVNSLFSPMNNFNMPTSSLFMPVQDQHASALLMPESVEEDSFLGQPTQQASSVPTFTNMFSQSANADPFATISNSSSNGVASPQQEPQLFVPPASPTTSDPQPLVPDPQPTFASQPAQNFNSPPPLNPYARSAVGGARQRPMFPSNPTLYNSQPNPMQKNSAPVFSPPTQNQTVPPTISNTTPPQMPPSVPNSFEALATTPPPPMMPGVFYQHVNPHWFYRKNLTDNNYAWCPFSKFDSDQLERSLMTNDNTVVRSDGGRYDVSVPQRQRTSVYWEEPNSMVRRCTWFSKADNEYRFAPYEEQVAERLESEYKSIIDKGDWHRRIELENGEIVVVHNPQLIVHFQPLSHKDDFGGVHETQMHSKTVKRGISGTDFIKDIPESETGTPDHVVFLCHGVGPVCDLRYRSIVECGESLEIDHLVLCAHGIGEGNLDPKVPLVQYVDDFRAIQLSLLQSHFKTEVEGKKAHRIEFLPVHWHRALHGDATGVDRNIRRLTLPSISRLRHFTNETLLDILFYSSPVYCQTIADTIGNEINSLHQLFMTRNPDFKGSMSLSGHSLGSLILFDLLCHQLPTTKPPDIQEPEETKPTLPDSKKANVLTSRPDTPSSISSRDCTGSQGMKSSSSVQSFKEEEVTLEEAIKNLGLGAFLPNFAREEMDMASLLMCSEADIKDIGLPMGPRKRLLGYLQEQREKEDKRKEVEAQLEAQLKLQEQASSALVLDNLPNNSHPQLDNFDSMGSFLSTATNVHVDFQQFDAGTGQPAVTYPQLNFHPQTLFALGSPIGMFLTVRGISELGEDFALPTCPGFINIFHPFDPVAYRVEPLVNQDFTMKPILVPHYKGRKRLHLELKDSLGRMGQELKQGIMRSVKLAIGSMQKFAQSHWHQQSTQEEVDEQVKTMTEQILDSEKSNENDDTASVTSDVHLVDVGLGRLNGGRRMDYVLQERPLESFNDYLFAFQSHLCYWNNEDTVLLMMKEIYSSMGVQTDVQIAKRQVLNAPQTLQSASQGPPQMATIPLG